MKIRFVYLVVLLLCFNNIMAQLNDENQGSGTADYYHVYLKNGTDFIGKFLNEDNKNYYFLKENAQEVQFQKSDILKFIYLKGYPKIKRDVFWNYDSYLLDNSAFVRPKGSLSFENTFLVLNGFNYSINNYISCKGFAAPFSIVSEELGNTYGFSAKVGNIKLPYNIWYAFGYHQFNFLSEYYYKALLNYFTFGNKINNLTLGIGLMEVKENAYSSIKGEKRYITTASLINFAFTRRILTNISFTSENWISYYFEEPQGIMSAVIRYNNSKLNFGLGFFASIPYFEDGAILPYLHFKFML